MIKHLIAAGALGLSLSACSQEKAADTSTAAPPAASTPAAPPAASTATDTGVNRAEPAAPAPPVPALATQPGPKGTQVALTKARVTGDILTVELQYSLPATAEGSETAIADIDQITYIDDATSRKYNVLKDQEGTYMALPLNYNKKSVQLYVRKNGPSIASFKFPAPPASSQTISLSLPEVGTFDAIPLQR